VTRGASSEPRRRVVHTTAPRSRLRHAAARRACDATGSATLDSSAPRARPHRADRSAAPRPPRAPFELLGGHRCRFRKCVSRLGHCMKVVRNDLVNNSLRQYFVRNRRPGEIPRGASCCAAPPARQATLHSEAVEASISRWRGPARRCASKPRCAAAVRRFRPMSWRSELSVSSARTTLSRVASRTEHLLRRHLGTRCSHASNEPRRRVVGAPRACSGACAVQDGGRPSCGRAAADCEPFRPRVGPHGPHLARCARSVSRCRGVEVPAI